ncbi:MAG: zinc-ribbon domain-containing protein [Burkholderiaceae bacterium]
MKSNKKRRKEIMQRRQERAATWFQSKINDVRFAASSGSTSRISADPAQLAHNSTYNLLPKFYEDRAFTCKDCGTNGVWTAAQQKWWYEIAKGNIDSQAVRCLRCRKTRREFALNNADLLREWTARLRALSNHAPDESAQLEVENALSSKWWGIRTTAVGVLGSWGGSANIQRLRNWIKEAENAAYRSWEYHLGEAASRAIAHSVGRADAFWLIPAYLNDSKHLSNWLRPVLRLPASELKEPISQALHSTDKNIAWRAFVVLANRMDFPQRRSLLAALCNSPHSMIAKNARWYCEKD